MCDNCEISIRFILQVQKFGLIHAQDKSTIIFHKREQQNCNFQLIIAQNWIYYRRTNLTNYNSPNCEVDNLAVPSST